MSKKETSYACLHFRDLKCDNSKMFPAFGCWCVQAEARKNKDEPKPMTTMEAIFLGFIGSK